jgi:hypothetical protein
LPTGTKEKPTEKILEKSNRIEWGNCKEGIAGHTRRKKELVIKSGNMKSLF